MTSMAMAFMLTHRFFKSEKPVAHPPTGCTISTDVSKSFLMVSIGCTEGNFFNSLVDNQALRRFQLVSRRLADV